MFHLSVRDNVSLILARAAPVEAEKVPALQFVQFVAPAVRVACVCARACRGATSSLHPRGRGNEGQTDLGVRVSRVQLARARLCIYCPALCCVCVRARARAWC